MTGNDVEAQRGALHRLMRVTASADDDDSARELIDVATRRRVAVANEDRIFVVYPGRHTF